MAKGPQPGDQAPDFELPGTDGPFRLSEHRGRRVLLLFYPGDETMVCTKQFCSYRDRAPEMDELDANVVGISTQDLDSHRSFTSNHGLNVPLLSDSGGEVASLYGVKRPVMGNTRATFGIDAQGVVRYRHVHRLGLSFEGVDDLREALAQAGG